MPVLGSARSLALKHGAPCYTPDRRGLVEPIPAVEGLYVMAGDNEAGLTNGPAFAKAFADHITHGSSKETWSRSWDALLTDPSGTTFPLRGVNMMRVRDGRFEYVHAYYDPTALTQDG